MILWKLGWLALESLLFAFFLGFGSSEAMGLAVGLLLIPLVSLPVNLYIRRGIQVSFRTPSSLRKQEHGEIMLCLANTHPIPAFRFCATVCVVNQLNGQKETIRINTGLWSKKGERIPLCLGSQYSGRLRISATRVMLYDCFGLVGVRCNGEPVAHVTIQPDTFEMHIAFRPGADSAQDSEIYAQERPGSDLTETFQLREYVPGDSPRQIHWKLSGKLDRLIVKEPAFPVTRNLLLFWERTGESGDPDRIDAQAEVMVSLCKALVDQSVPFTVGWNDTDRNLCLLHEIRGLEELVGIIPRLMRATGAKTGVSGAELLLQTGGHALCAHMVYLAETPQQGVSELERYGWVTKLVCGENHGQEDVFFDPVHYPQQLSQIEV